VSARRVEVADETSAAATLAKPDRISAFEITRPAGDARSAEQWARAAWENGPRALSSFILAGWIIGLGFRLGPRPSPDHVQGWTIVTSTPDTIVLEAKSRFMISHNVVQVEGSRVLWTTFVRYEKRSARLLWSLAAPVHHRTLPYLLGRAAAA
jgi:hypothetical protein